jgi:hypothetical protein
VFCRKEKKEREKIEENKNGFQCVTLSSSTHFKIRKKKGTSRIFFLNHRIDSIHNFSNKKSLVFIQM